MYDMTATVPFCRPSIHRVRTPHEQSTVESHTRLQPADSQTPKYFLRELPDAAKTFTAHSFEYTQAGSVPASCEYGIAETGPVE
jgi:hypothetical protein